MPSWISSLQGCISDKRPSLNGSTVLSAFYSCSDHLCLHIGKKVRNRAEMMLTKKKVKCGREQSSRSCQAFFGTRIQRDDSLYAKVHVPVKIWGNFGRDGESASSTKGTLRTSSKGT